MDSSRALWRKFEKSGKLTDYLDFCRERRRQQQADGELHAREEPARDQSSL